jgi:hypothetical protein
MARIDLTYFTDFRSIANLSDEAISSALTEKINRLEPQFFIDVFGYEFQKLMLANPTDPIYKPILEGVEFTDSNGKLMKWEGINESIANYVYFYWWKERTPMNGGVSFAAGKVENATVVNPQDRPVYAFNMIQDALLILYSYLSVNIENYPTLEFSLIKKLNTFGL